MTPFDRELQLAQQLALAAGKHALRYYQAGVHVEFKDTGEPVTIADREASDLILAGLRAEFPTDGFVSEEEPIDVALLPHRQRLWLIDPIDGTRDFIGDHSGWVVMIALLNQGRPCLGVIYQPVGDRLFFAASGSGAHVVTAEGQRILQCSTQSDVRNIRLVSSKSRRSPQLQHVKKTLQIDDDLSIGSVGLKVGLIALGERDLYVNPSSKSKIWDTAAPEALLAEAGGTMTDVRGRPLVYDSTDLWNRHGVVASNGLLHAEVIKKLETLLPLTYRDPL